MSALPPFTAQAAPRVALVTGGTSGIGEGIARALAADGWQVRAGGVVPAEIERFSPQEGITTTLLDVTDDASVAAFVGAAPRVDALINAAGIIGRQKEFAIEGFRHTLEVNLVGTMRCCLAAHEALKASGGAIVNVSSMWATFGSPVSPGYTASKGGVSQLTKSLAVAWAAEGIRVNAISPGWVATPLTAALREDPVREAQILSRTPMGRWAEPADIAGAVAFLLSPAARFITGTVLPVDGGYLAVG